MEPLPPGLWVPVAGAALPAPGACGARRLRGGELCGVRVAEAPWPGSCHASSVRVTSLARSQWPGCCGRLRQRRARCHGRAGSLGWGASGREVTLGLFSPSAAASSVRAGRIRHLWDAERWCPLLVGTRRLLGRPAPPVPDSSVGSGQSGSLDSPPRNALQRLRPGAVCLDRDASL